MSQHFEALEADFQREYAIDLRDALWGEQSLSPRRILALVRGLPPNSALQRSVTAGQSWTNTEELLATIAEVLDIGNQMFYQINTKKGSKPWKPLIITRPGQSRDEATKMRRKGPPRKRPPLSTPTEVSNFFSTHGKVVVDGV